jgi:hypothetical protein
MGQQQLLLLILGVVMVGLAVVVGLQAYSQNRVKSNGDQLVVDGIRIATDAQAWYQKGQAYGGGAGSYDGLSLEVMGWQTNGEGDYQNSYGTWAITTVESQRFLLEGTAVGDPPFNTICVRVIGADPEDITADLNLDTCTFD